MDHGTTATQRWSFRRLHAVAGRGRDIGFREPYVDAALRRRYGCFADAGCSYRRGENPSLVLAPQYHRATLVELCCRVDFQRVPIDVYVATIQPDEREFWYE